MLQKSIPPSLDAVKVAINRFLAELLQGANQQVVHDNSMAETALLLAANVVEKPSLPTHQIEFVATPPPAVATSRSAHISELFAELPVDIVAVYERKYAAMNMVIARELQQVFQQVLLRPEKQQQRTRPQDDALTLIDDEALMFRLALDQFSARINDQYQVGIALSCLRFEKVLGFETDLLLSPLAPYTIGGVLEKAIVMLDMNILKKKQLMLAILNGVMAEYPRLLKLANNVFIQKGILPDLTERDAKLRIEKYVRKMKAEEERKKKAASSGEAGGEDSAAVARDFFKDIHIPRESEHTVVSNPDGVLIPQQHLLKNIGSMQSVLVNTDQQSGYMQPAETQGMFAELLAENTDIGEYALSAEHSKTISIISMLFDTLKSEEGISGPIKALLIQLTVPLLKAALQDDEFFSDKSNPAQILFNSIADASSSWTAANNVSGDFLYQKMSEVVQKVTDNYEQDYSVFESAVDDFESYVDNEKQKSLRIEDRIVAAETASARIQAARKLAQGRVFDVFGDFILDEELKRFIDQSWEQALFYIANNTMEDPDHPQWHDVANIEASLVKILDYQPLDIPLAELLADISHLFVQTGRVAAEVQKELALIDTELQALIAQVPAAPETKLVAKPVATVVPLVKKAAPLNTPAPVQASHNAVPASANAAETAKQLAEQASVAELLSEVGIGCWMEDKENNPAIKVKLAAHIKYTDTYVFVNRKGVKAASYDGPALAVRLKNKLMVMMDNSNLYGRSMETIIGNLRN